MDLAFSFIILVFISSVLWMMSPPFLFFLFLLLFFYFEKDTRALEAGTMPDAVMMCVFSSNSLFYLATSRHKSNSEYLINFLSLYYCISTRFSLCIEVKVFSSISLSVIVSADNFRREAIL